MNSERFTVGLSCYLSRYTIRLADYVCYDSVYIFLSEAPSAFLLCILFIELSTNHLRIICYTICYISSNTHL